MADWTKDQLVSPAERMQNSVRGQGSNHIELFWKEIMDEEGM